MSDHLEQERAFDVVFIDAASEHEVQQAIEAHDKDNFALHQITMAMDADGARYFCLVFMRQELKVGHFPSFVWEMEGDPVIGSGMDEAETESITKRIRQAFREAFNA